MLVLVLLQPGLAADSEEPFVRLTGAAAEAFLLETEIIDSERIPVGVTKPRLLTLTDGSRTARAIWKTISEYRHKQEFYDGLPAEFGFRDSYKSEIAAYELDKLLGFSFVPPTVMRRLRRTRGSLQWWLEHCMTEAERRERGLEPPDSAAWAEQVANVRLFHQVIHDNDYRNTSNLLVDRNFRLWVIDHSRAFRNQVELLNEGYLERFSSRGLARLRELTPGLLEAKLGRWLTPRQQRALLGRRDLILRRVETLIAARGEAAVLF